MIAAAVLLAGCATMEPDPENADPGPPPRDYAQQVRNDLRRTLFDPTSVIDLRIGAPRPGVYFKGQFDGGAFAMWASCVSLNAKNRFGGYTGRQTYVYWFERGRLFDAHKLGAKAHGTEHHCYPS